MVQAKEKLKYIEQKILTARADIVASRHPILQRLYDQKTKCKNTLERLQKEEDQLATAAATAVDTPGGNEEEPSARIRNKAGRAKTKRVCIPLHPHLLAPLEAVQRS